jgi:hypothetical protein
MMNQFRELFVKLPQFIEIKGFSSWPPNTQQEASPKISPGINLTGAFIRRLQRDFPQGQPPFLEMFGEIIQVLTM